MLLASGDRFGSIHVWETETGNEFATLRGHSGGITGLVWSADGNQLTSASLDGSVRIWNMHTLETDKQMVAHDRGVLSLGRGSQNGIVTTGRDGWIRNWSLDTSKVFGQFKITDEAIAVCSVGTSANPHAILCTDAAGGIYRFSQLPTDSVERSTGTQIPWPIAPQTRVLASIAPTAVKRIIATDSKDHTQESLEVAPTMPSRTNKTLETDAPVVASDLEESRRALASIERSLEQSYRTAEQLEETVARLKQMIVLQEARLKQAELRQKPNRTLK